MNFKHLIFFAFFFILYTLFFVPHVFAQSNYVINDIPKTQEKSLNQNYIHPNTNADVPLNMHTWMQSLLIESASAFTCQIIGLDPISPNQKCLGIDPKTKKIGFVENGGGIITVLATYIGDMYTPPVTTSDYTSYLAHNFGVSKNAYAEEPCNKGIGYCGIKPLMSVWKAIRDVVYMFFIIIFVFIGVAIMLRIKIDPRTVMTIENQIPKLIIGLLLITFSFGIAGALIDLMYVATSLFINIFSPFGGAPLTLDNAQSTNVFEFFNGTIGFTKVAWFGSASMGGMMSKMLGSWDQVLGTPIYGAMTYFALKAPILNKAGSFLGLLLSHIIPDFSIPFIGGPKISIQGIVEVIQSLAIGTAISAYFGASSFAKILAFVIILFAVFWSLIRIFFTLLMSYIYILIDITLAPLIIFTGVVPGASPGFSGWLRDLLANLAVYPLVILLFLLGRVFMFQFGTAPQSAGQLFIPPMLGNQTDANNLQFLIGLGILLLAPKAIDMTRDTFKSPEFKYASVIGQAFGAGAGSLKNVASNTVLGLRGGSKPGDKGLGAVLKKTLGV